MSDSQMRSCTTVPYVGLERMLDEEGMLGVSDSDSSDMMILSSFLKLQTSLVPVPP